MILHLLYQDKDIIVVDKPAGLPTHAADPADPYPADALRVVQAQTGLSYLGMHQRLDADTSGVLLFSARPEANRNLAAAFEGRAVRKVYLALVIGRPRQPEGVIDAPIVRDRDGRYRGRPQLIRAASPPGRGIGWRHGRISAAAATGHRSAGLRPCPKSSDPARSHPRDRPQPPDSRTPHIGCPVAGDPLYGDTQQPLFLGCACTRAAHPAASGDRPVRHLHHAPPRPFAGRLAGRPEPPHAQEAASSDLVFSPWIAAPLAADAGTTIYRLVNGAADACRHNVDRYGDVLVASVYDQEVISPFAELGESRCKLCLRQVPAAPGQLTQRWVELQQLCARGAGRGGPLQPERSSRTRTGWRTSSGPARG